MSDNNPTRNLLPHDREHSRASGINGEPIEKMGIYSVTDPDEARTLLRWREGGEAPPVIALRYSAFEEYTRRPLEEP